MEYKVPKNSGTWNRREFVLSNSMLLCRIGSHGFMLSTRMRYLERLLSLPKDTKYFYDGLHIRLQIVIFSVLLTIAITDRIKAPKRIFHFI
jgi:hypothetical protein